MGANGIREFIKWYYPQLKKEGLVVDVRANGGGNGKNVFRAYRYAANYPGLAGKPLTPGKPLEEMAVNATP